jgi:hypothetical protein
LLIVWTCDWVDQRRVVIKTFKNKPEECEWCREWFTSYIYLHEENWTKISCKQTDTIYEYYYCLGYDTVESGRSLKIFLRRVARPSSDSTRESCKKGELIFSSECCVNFYKTIRYHIIHINPFSHHSEKL